MPEQIVPPVSTADLTIALAELHSLGNVKQDLNILQRFARADKTVVIAAIVHVILLLTACFKLHLDAKQVAVIGSIVSGGIGLLLQMHINSKS